MEKIKVKKQATFTRVLTSHNFGISKAYVKGEKLKQAIEHYKQDANIYTFSILDNFDNEVYYYNADSGTTKNLLIF